MKAQSNTKIIQKLIIPVGILILGIFLLCACGGPVGGGEKEEVSKYAGKWEAETATASGVEMDIANIFSEFTLVLNTDGSAEIVVGEQTAGGEWAETETGVVITNTGLSDNLEEDSLEMTDQDGELVLHYSGMEVTFTQTSSAGE